VLGRARNLCPDAVCPRPGRLRKRLKEAELKHTRRKIDELDPAAEGGGAEKAAAEGVDAEDEAVPERRCSPVSYAASVLPGRRGLAWKHYMRCVRVLNSMALCLSFCALLWYWTQLFDVAQLQLPRFADPKIDFADIPVVVIDWGSGGNNGNADAELEQWLVWNNTVNGTSPTPYPTHSLTPTPSLTPSITPSMSVTPSGTPSGTPTSSLTPSPTPSRSRGASVSPIPATNATAVLDPNAFVPWTLDQWFVGPFGEHSAPFLAVTLDFMLGRQRFPDMLSVFGGASVCAYFFLVNLPVASTDEPIYPDALPWQWVPTPSPTSTVQPTPYDPAPIRTSYVPKVIPPPLFSNMSISLIMAFSAVAAALAIHVFASAMVSCRDRCCCGCDVRRKERELRINRTAAALATAATQAAGAVGAVSLLLRAEHCCFRSRLRKKLVATSNAPNRWKTGFGLSTPKIAPSSASPSGSPMFHATGAAKAQAPVIAVPNNSDAARLLSPANEQRQQQRLSPSPKPRVRFVDSPQPPGATASPGVGISIKDPMSPALSPALSPGFSPASSTGASRVDSLDSLMFARPTAAVIPLSTRSRIGISTESSPSLPGNATVSPKKSSLKVSRASMVLKSPKDMASAPAGTPGPTVSLDLPAGSGPKPEQRQPLNSNNDAPSDESDGSFHAQDPPAAPKAADPHERRDTLPHISAGPRASPVASPTARTVRENQLSPSDISALRRVSTRVAFRDVPFIPTIRSSYLSIRPTMLSPATPVSPMSASTVSARSRRSSPSKTDVELQDEFRKDMAKAPLIPLLSVPTSYLTESSNWYPSCFSDGYMAYPCSTICRERKHRVLDKFRPAVVSLDKKFDKLRKTDRTKDRLRRKQVLEERNRGTDMLSKSAAIVKAGFMPESVSRKNLVDSPSKPVDDGLGGPVEVKYTIAEDAPMHRDWTKNKRKRLSIAYQDDFDPPSEDSFSDSSSSDSDEENPTEAGLHRKFTRKAKESVAASHHFHDAGTGNGEHEVVWTPGTAGQEITLSPAPHLLPSEAYSILHLGEPDSLFMPRTNLGGTLTKTRREIDSIPGRPPNWTLEKEAEFQIALSMQPSGSRFGPKTNNLARSQIILSPHLV
jgi:hypothetical protein